jgi:putative Mn2+ efflux pump MntP
MMMLQTHVDTVLLAVASSTDNLMVGISVGLSSKKPANQQFVMLNLVVALCNASGTLLATYCGDALKKLPERALKRLAEAVSSSSSPEAYILNFSMGSLLAGMAFAYLAWKECTDTNNNGRDGIKSDDEQDKTSKGSRHSCAIAFPMTLNNLAGGVAAGAMGMPVFEATLYAFVVSLGSMALGHSLATRVVDMQQTYGSTAASTWCKKLSILVYLLLSLQSFLNV